MLGWSYPAAASPEHPAVITALEGQAMLLSNESETANGPSPRAKFEKKYYTFQFPKVGDSIRNGDILRTLPGGRARVVFKNGDQMNLAPGSAYRIAWRAGQAPVVDILQGGLRATVQPKGPRSGMSVRTRAVTLGVRGTEFYAEDLGWGPTAQSNITLIRGQAEAQPRIRAGQRAAKPVQLQSGQTATVAVATAFSGTGLQAAPSGSSVLVQPASVQEIARARDAARIAAKAILPAEENGLSPELAALEKKAARVVVDDIKLHEPALYQKLVTEAGSEEKVAQLDEAAVVQAQERTLLVHQETAPSRPAPVPISESTPLKKPSLQDLKRKEESAYEKYTPPAE